MKTILFTLALLISSLSPTAQAEESKFLGTFPLRITERAWEPNQNSVPVGDITHDGAYADYRFQPDADLNFSIRPGNTYGFGCNTADVVQRYFLLVLNEAGEVVAEVEVGDGTVEAVAGIPYVLRVRLSNLKACQGFGTAFVALRR